MAIKANPIPVRARNRRLSDAVPLCVALLVVSVSTAPAGTGGEILQQSGLPGGLVVHLGCGDGSLTVELTNGKTFLVHGLALSDAEVTSARTAIAAKSLAGIVTVERATAWDPLPYATNLVNVLVVDLDALGAHAPTAEEMRRVAAPFGTIFTKKAGAWTSEKVPLPPQMDEWTHFDHGPDRNPLSRDMLAGPATSLQWIGHYALGRNGMNMRVAGGRFFYPRSNSAVFCRDAFSGVMLWQVPANLPLNVNQAMIATADKVIAPLNRGEPMTLLNAATGEKVLSYAAADTIVVPGWGFYSMSTALHNGNLYVANQRNLHCVDAETGVKKWTFSYSDTLFLHAPTLDTVGGRVFVFTSTSGAGADWNASDHSSYSADYVRDILAVNMADGNLLWGSEATKRPGYDYGRLGRMVFHPRHGLLTLYGNHAKDTWQNVTLFDPATGERPFSRGLEKDKSPWTYTLPDGATGSVGMSVRDIVVDDDCFSLFTGTKVAGYKIADGVVKNIYAAASGVGELCMHGSATPRYLFKAEGIVMDRLGKSVHVTQMMGSCGVRNFIGYGMTFNGESSCKCYQTYRGVRAQATRDLLVPIADSRRLEKGPGMGKQRAESAAQLCSPCYENALGVNHAQENTGNPLRDDWVSNDVFPGTKTNPASAGAVSIVADIHTHTLTATQSGQTVWTFVAGGRVSGKPVVDQGRCVFGSHDGWVYCLDAATGVLQWRFLAAPNDEKMVAYSQVESAWPVFGVATNGGAVYATAGRHPDYNGGIFAWAIRGADGGIVWKSRISRWPTMGVRGVDASHRVWDRSGSNALNRAPTINGGTLSIFGVGFSLTDGRLVGTGDYYTEGPPAGWTNIRRRGTIGEGKSPVAAGTVALEMGRFHLLRPTGVRVTLHDTAGRTVVVVYEGEAKAGYNSFVVPATRAQGILFLRLTAGGTIRTRSVLSL